MSPVTVRGPVPVGDVGDDEDQVAQLGAVSPVRSDLEHEQRLRRDAAAALALVRAAAVAFVVVQTWLYEPPDGLELPFARWTVPVACTLAAVVVSTLGLALARSSSLRVQRTGAAVETVADALIVLGLLTAFSFDGQSQLWALLLLPAMEAAWRHRLWGAFAVWGLLAAGYLLRDLWAAANHAHVTFAAHSVTYRTGIVLVVTLTAALLARRLERTSRDLLATGRALSLQARTDPLTGVASREHVLETVAGLLEDRRPCAVAQLDVDGFKQLNDLVGHRGGDEVLAVLAGRLAACARERTLLGRLGGDEFALVLPDVADAEEAAELVGDLQVAARRPLYVETRELRVSLTAGLVVADGDHHSVAEVQRDLDLALQEAKRRGRGALAHYSPTLGASLRRRVHLLADLPQALRAGEIHAVYQPIVTATTGGVAGFEALVRWTHPRLDPVAPPEIVDLAAAAGLGEHLAISMVEDACRRVARWRRWVPDAFVSVNLDASQVTDAARLLDGLLEALRRHGLPPGALVLEVTESSMVDDGTPIAELLGTARRHGLRVAMDDFGREHSSLARLRRLELDLLKLDRELVVDLTGANRDPAALAAIVQLAATFGLAIVAEGIETPVQRDTVGAVGCDYAQGYHWAAPLDPDHVEVWLGQLPASAGGLHATSALPGDLSGSPRPPEGLPGRAELPARRHGPWEGAQRHPETSLAAGPSAVPPTGQGHPSRR